MSAIGYIGFQSKQPVDNLLAASVAALLKRHVRIAGVLQPLSEECTDCAGALILRDVEDGSLIRYSQDLGEGAAGCSLDPQALAGVAQRITLALERKPQLVVINRFGKAEAEGHGLRSVFEHALIAEIPILVAVRDDFRPEWEAFHGGMATRLPFDEAAVLAWCDGAVG